MFVLPPNSPGLNGCVERANLPHTEEFYEVTDSSPNIAELNSELLVWEKVYNMVHPHQSSGYLMPKECLDYYKQNDRKEVMCQ